MSDLCWENYARTSWFISPTQVWPKSDKSYQRFFRSIFVRISTRLLWRLWRYSVQGVAPGQEVLHKQLQGSPTRTGTVTGISSNPSPQLASQCPCNRPNGSLCLSRGSSFAAEGPWALHPLGRRLGSKSRGNWSGKSSKTLLNHSNHSKMVIAFLQTILFF